MSLNYNCPFYRLLLVKAGIQGTTELLGGTVKASQSVLNVCTKGGGGGHLWVQTSANQGEGGCLGPANVCNNTIKSQLSLKPFRILGLKSQVSSFRLFYYSL